MSTPVKELPAPKHAEKKNRTDDHSPTSDEGTYINEGSQDTHGNNHLTVDTSSADDLDRTALRSPSAQREQAKRLEDDLALLEAEKVASRSTHEDTESKGERNSISRSRSHRSQNVDEFDEATNPLHEKAAVYNPPESPNTNIARFVKKIHESSFIIRYITYIVPLVLILLIPLLVGALAYPDANVGGVELLWFSVWLEIVWLTLWAGRVCILLSLSLFRFLLRCT